jgi:predicted lipoprotein with Yx(FWY)xxD motif
MKIWVTAVAMLFLFAASAMADHHAVKVAEKADLGKYLTDAKGMTLYWYAKDAPGTSTCAGPCVERWPLYFRESVAATGGLKAEDFGTITREDGKKQTTYKGYPLYYWVQDKKPGDTTGHAVNNVWWVVNPEKFSPAK